LHGKNDSFVHIHAVQARLADSGAEGAEGRPSCREQIARQVLQARVDGHGRDGFARP